MENLIKRLQDEAGLTQDQAVKALGIVKDFMDKENLKIDWNAFFKGKYEEFSQMFKELPDKAHPYKEKISETVDSAVSKVRKGAYEITKKAADFLDENKS